MLNDNLAGVENFDMGIGLPTIGLTLKRPINLIQIVYL